ncbi:DUF3558 domain-containing protein [Nocardia amamiensis]|uniref:DUF3558 domain-containing protein n=1 Tax=Nocardia amamiensis TaxID=404578 RepID=UPI00082AADED|nr:DUF3558 domain-containing protein [Nocardia amamiensis]
MRTADVLRAVLGGAAVLALVTGCGSTMDGTATTTSKSAGDIQIFNPCTQLSDDVLRATGLDPATKHVVTDAPEGPTSWRICAWSSTDLPYRVDVASSSHTVDETRANDRETGFRDVMIGPRTGLIHQDKTDTRGETCRVAIPAEQGMFVISASWRASKPITHDRCDLAAEHARDLEPSLPK